MQEKAYTCVAGRNRMSHGGSLFVVWHKGKGKLAFTLVELVVTIAIIGVLAGILIPSIVGYVKMAKMESLNNNARTVFLSVQNYLTGWTGDGNDASELQEDGELDLTQILPEVPQKEKDENSENIKYLALARTDGNKQDKQLYQILTNYISDELLQERSIFVSYNEKTGKVRSAFVSEGPFLSVAGEPMDPTNIYDRTESALWEKEQGYYGVDDTGTLPDRREAQTLAVRIINSKGMLRVECDIADYLNVKENTQYEFHVSSLEDPKRGYTFTFDPNLAVDQVSGGNMVWAVNYPNAKTAIEKADPSKPMVYAAGVDPDGTGHIVWILDVFSEWNAYNSKKDMGIAACYPDLPVGMLDAEVTAKAADTGDKLAVEQSENTEHSYFDSQEKETDGSITYILRDARQLNNIRYMTSETSIVGKFRQDADISMRTFFDEKGDKVLAEGARVTIAPLGAFAGDYNAQASRIDMNRDGNYRITDLMVASQEGQTGLFSVNSGRIGNLTIEGAQIGSADEPVRTNGGILAGMNGNTGVIQNCSVSGSVTGGIAAGGVAGVNNGHIKYCRSGVFPAPGAADADSYAYDNTCRYTEKILKESEPVSVEREFPCMILSGQNGEKNPAVGGVAGINTRVVTECANISQVEIPYGTEGGTAGGLVGQNKAGGQVYQSYNAGRTASSANGSSVGGVAGLNDGGIVYQCYNTGRVNLKNNPENNYGNDMPLANGNIGGVVGYNRDTGQVAECYAINYIGYPKDGIAGTAAGGIIGRDDTTTADFVSDCCFLAAENVTVPVGESALTASHSLRALYDPDDLVYYFTDDPWHTDDPALQGTFNYPYPYLEKLASRQCTPWEQIIPATPTLTARIQNGELLTAEWKNDNSIMRGSIDVEFLDEKGAVVDRIVDLIPEEICSVTSVQAALRDKWLSGQTGNAYPVYYDEEDGFFKIVLDGLDIDGNGKNGIDNYFREQQAVGVRVTYPQDVTAVSNLENTLYANTDPDGKKSAVSNARHLYNVRYRADSFFIQTADIVMGNYDGSEAAVSPVELLTGGYNGNGFEISRLNVRANGPAGLFAQVGGTGTVTNLTLSSGTVSGKENVGGIAGINLGTVSACTVKADVTVTGAADSADAPKNIGGIVGTNAGGAAGGTGNPLTPGYNYIHLGSGKWEYGDVFYKPDHIYDGYSPYLSFETLDFGKLGVPAAQQVNPQTIYIKVKANGTTYQLYRWKSAWEITKLTMADLQGMGEKAAQGYFIRCNITSDPGGYGAAVALAELTNEPGYAEAVSNSGEITGCVNEAGLVPEGTENEDDRIGGIAGLNEGRIRACRSGTIPAPTEMTVEQVISNPTGYTAGTARMLGGIAGDNTGEIADCVNAAQVSSSAAGGLAGGIAGNNRNRIDRCYNAGTVRLTGAGGSVGGVAGNNGKEIINCYNTGRVNVETSQVVSTGCPGGKIGGVIGLNRAGAKLSACYNIGYVGAADGTGNAGGVVGCNENMDTGAQALQELYTLATNELSKDAIGNGVPPDFSNAPVSMQELAKVLPGAAFTADEVPVAQTYQYPYPYLTGDAVQCTPWEDNALPAALSDEEKAEPSFVPERSIAPDTEPPSDETPPAPKGSAVPSPAETAEPEISPPLQLGPDTAGSSAEPEEMDGEAA